MTLSYRSLHFVLLSFAFAGCAMSVDDSDQDDDPPRVAPQGMSSSGAAHVSVEKTQLHELQSNGLPGRFLGWLFKDENFRVDHAGTYWCRGHAYGGLHQDGIVPCDNLSPGYK